MNKMENYVEVIKDLAFFGVGVFCWRSKFHVRSSALAKAAKISISTLGRIEEGDGSQFTNSHISISRVIGVDMKAIIDIGRDVEIDVNLWKGNKTA